MTFALAFVPLVAVSGAAVDLTRASREKDNLAHATDSAVLAIGKEIKTKTPAELKTLATTHLQAIDAGADYAVSGNPEVNSTKSEVCINTTSTMPTIFMQVVGYKSVALNGRACAKLGGTTYEIALSLDVTGSMDDGGKITSMKTAAKNFIDSVLPSSGTQNGYVKVSIVPFSSAVKAFDPDVLAGTGGTDEATRYNNILWMDVNGNSSIHWENFPKVTGGSFNPVSRFRLFSNMNQKWGGCFEARPGAYALRDTAPNRSTPDTLFVPLLAPDEGDSNPSPSNNYLSDYGNSICVNSTSDPYRTRDRQSPYFSDGQSMLCKYKAGTSSSNRTIKGACTTTSEQYTYTVREKQEVCVTTYDKKGKAKEKCDDEWVNVEKTGTRDVTTCEPDTIETVTTDKTLSVTTSYGRGPNFSCPSHTVMALSNNATNLKAKIDTLTAGGNTNIIEGTMWGWWTVSPNGPYGGTEAYTKPNHKKVIVLMTDGVNTWGTDRDNNNVSDYSPFGFFWNNRLGSAGGTIGNVSSSNVRNYMDAKTLEACTNAKAAGIEIYTVAFSHTSYPIDTQGQNLLKACATDSSRYYLVTNGSQLNLAFQNIGNSLDGLHLSR